MKFLNSIIPYYSRPTLTVTWFWMNSYHWVSPLSVLLGEYPPLPAGGFSAYMSRLGAAPSPGLESLPGISECTTYALVLWGVDRISRSVFCIILPGRLMGILGCLDEAEGALVAPAMLAGPDVSALVGW